MRAAHAPAPDPERNVVTSVDVPLPVVRTSNLCTTSPLADDVDVTSANSQS